MQLAQEVEAREQQDALIASCSPRERAILQTFRDGVTPVGLMIVRAMLKRAELFKMSLPAAMQAAIESADVRAPDAG
jgi:hypothetical protein